jgi:hypothetical protein
LPENQLQYVLDAVNFSQNDIRQVAHSRLELFLLSIQHTVLISFSILVIQMILQSLLWSLHIISNSIVIDEPELHQIVYQKNWILDTFDSVKRQYSNCISTLILLFPYNLPAYPLKSCCLLPVRIHKKTCLSLSYTSAVQVLYVLGSSVPCTKA